MKKYICSCIVFLFLAPFSTQITAQNAQIDSIEHWLDTWRVLDSLGQVPEEILYS